MARNSQRNKFKNCNRTWWGFIPMFGGHRRNRTGYRLLDWPCFTVKLPDQMPHTRLERKTLRTFIDNIQWSNRWHL